jgi:hypothetical protein
MRALLFAALFVPAVALAHTPTPQECVAWGNLTYQFGQIAAQKDATREDAHQALTEAINRDKPDFITDDQDTKLAHQLLDVAFDEPKLSPTDLASASFRACMSIAKAHGKPQFEI